MTKGFIQILHNGDNHWITVSTVGLHPSHISVYDSLYTSLSKFTKDHICALLHTAKPMISVQFMNVQRQCNSYDCGVYAMAYATSLCCGEDVSGIEYDNQKMRGHLLSCLEIGKITTFPSKQRDKGNPLREERIPVHCYCRMADTGAMIECHTCQQWFHVKCDKSISKRCWKKPNYTWKCRNCKG